MGKKWIQFIALFAFVTSTALGLAHSSSLQKNSSHSEKKQILDSLLRNNTTKTGTKHFSHAQTMAECNLLDEQNECLSNSCAPILARIQFNNFENFAVIVKILLSSKSKLLTSFPSLQLDRPPRA